MNKLFGGRLANKIREKGMSQKELASSVGITEAALSHYIKGDRVPRACTLAKIAVFLETTSDFLMNGVASNVQEEIVFAERLIARNATNMSREEKMRIIQLLMGDNTRRAK